MCRLHVYNLWLQPVDMISLLSALCSFSSFFYMLYISYLCYVSSHILYIFEFRSLTSYIFSENLYICMIQLFGGNWSSGTYYVLPNGFVSNKYDRIFEFRKNWVPNSQPMLVPSVSTPQNSHHMVFNTNLALWEDWPT